MRDADWQKYTVHECIDHSLVPSPHYSTSIRDDDNHNHTNHHFLDLFKLWFFKFLNIL